MSVQYEPVQYEHCIFLKRLEDRQAAVSEPGFPLLQPLERLKDSTRITQDKKEGKPCGLSSFLYRELFVGEAPGLNASGVGIVVAVGSFHDIPVGPMALRHIVEGA